MVGFGVLLAVARMSMPGIFFLEAKLLTRRFVGRICNYNLSLTILSLFLLLTHLLFLGEPLLCPSHLSHPFSVEASYGIDHLALAVNP